MRYDNDGAFPWYLRPPEWMGGDWYLWPTVYIFRRVVISAVSPKSYVNVPRFVEGTAFGSHATKSASSFLWSLSPRNGLAKPAKLDPPPMHPAITAGCMSIDSNCFFASR